ncbi:hypothetical protein FSS13T_20330 [Flavobacterium saliperosum S13]|uniref:DUF1569 domain-containing protein n=2 Tax=Flavobacterium saliperosum TaxID=329186 RepID=A0A1G4VT50_9FLAO|nr:DUF1569 domain-containing protein [Flavobacterium saliperosum]ESU24064.1 hypothetical protein FSS13T_20330 [Flavobacterium saliperosum S13]SCX10945.1 Protein of unknown function [Flavobacterium saliperosum]
MNNLFNPSDVSGILERIEKLTPDSPRQWGKMNAAQMLAHCNKSVETAMGQNFMKRLFIGRIIGTLLKTKVVIAKPFGKNSPTDKSYIFPDNCNFEEEKSKITASIRKFSEGGPSQCTTYPHPFFGKFTPEEWAVFQWKHLDHHLRQFGV